MTTDTRIAPSAHPNNPGLIQNGTVRWRKALDRLSRAQSAETAYDQAEWTPAYTASKSGGREIPVAIDDEMSRLQDERCKAQDAIIETEAPTLSALIWKVDMARKRWSDFSDWPANWWDAVMADLHRLDNAGGRSAPFDPTDWLARYTALGGVYVANGKLNLCILVNRQTIEELSQIRQMVVDLTDEQRAAILAFLNDPGATAQDTLDRYWHAFHTYNADQLDQDAYMAAFTAMWAWAPTTAHDFVRKFEAAWALGGCPTQENLDKMLADAIAILGPDSRSGEA